MTRQLPCYVVNLATDTQRRASMQQRLNERGVQAIFFEAVDGRIMHEAELESHVNRDKATREYGPLSRGEIGTSLSHIHIYRDMVAKNIPYAVILEDDVCLSDDFADLLTTESPNCLAKLFAPEHAVMVQLTHVRRGYKAGAKPVGISGREAVKPYGGMWLTGGYFITLAAAKNLSQGLYPVWAVADFWNRFEERGLLELWALNPNALWEAEEAQQSTLAANRTPRPKQKKTVGQKLLRVKDDLFVKPFLVKKLAKQTGSRKPTI
jgi:glycosyl transferase family 25